MDMSDLDLNDLETFARQCLAAERYPADQHAFQWLPCDLCGAAPLTLTIEHHSGSREQNFRGIIWARCRACGGRQRLFTFTGEHRHYEREEEPECRCGGKEFVVAMCERFEGQEGLTGFFDEGVVVATCTACGRNRLLVRTD